MRKLLRELAAGNKIASDTTTLEDFSVLEKLRQMRNNQVCRRIDLAKFFSKEYSGFS